MRALMLSRWSSRGLSLALACAAAPPLLQSGERDLLTIALTIVVFALCGAAHEAAHAWVAWRCGDSTAKDLGRLTLNPIPHIDLFMTVLLPAMLMYTTGMMFGGAKPVPVNFHRLRRPWRDMSFVAMAGPFSNLLLATFFLLAYRFFVTTGLYHQAGASIGERQDDLLPQVLVFAVRFNVLLAVFNLVPIPPLDGSRVMAWLLPESLRPPYLSLERFGILIVFGLIFLVPTFGVLLNRSVSAVIETLGRLVFAGAAI